MAPPRHEMWALFTETKPREKGVRDHPEAKCNACAATLKNAMPSENMLRHVIKCTELDESVKDHWKQHDAARCRGKAVKVMSSFARSPTSVNKRLFSSPAFGQHTARKSPCSASSTRTPRRPITRSVEDNFMRVAMGFYSTGIPFRVVEDPLFRAMFDYELPTRRQLSGRLLDRVYDRERLRTIAALKGKRNLALVTDGWSNNNCDSIINFIFTNTRISPTFWKSVNTAAEEHTGRYIADAILATINEVESVISSGAITAVITDNASNMKSAWTLVMKERPGIVCSGCGAHGMNLVMKDMLATDYFTDTLSDANVLTRFCKTRICLWSLFRERQSQMRGQGARGRGEKLRRLSMPAATRWYTHENCISNVVANKEIMAGIFSNSTVMKPYSGAELDEAMRVFRDDDFWLNVAVLKMMAPINSALAEFKNDDCSLSMIYHRFHTFPSDPVYTKPIEGCPPSVQQTALSILKARREKVCSSALKIANLLDPNLSTYCENAISLIDEATQLAQRLEFVTTEAKDAFHKQPQNFAVAKDEWGDKFAGFMPYRWWHLHGTAYGLVTKFAEQILCIPTSPASSKRNWSIHSFIHSKTRNRLTPKRVNNLVFVHCNNTQDSAVNHLLYEVFPDACGDNDSSGSNDVEVFFTLMPIKAKKYKRDGIGE